MAASFIKETDRKRSLTANKHLFLIRLLERRPKALCLACGYAVNWEKKHVLDLRGPGDFEAFI